MEADSVIVDSEFKPTAAAVIDQIIILKCSFSMIDNILFSPGFGNTPEYVYLMEMLKGIHAKVIREWGSEPKSESSTQKRHCKEPRPQRATQKLHCKDRSCVAIMAISNRFPAVIIKKISRQVR